MPAFQLPVTFLVKGVLLLVLRCIAVFKSVRVIAPDRSLTAVKLAASICPSPKARRLMIEFAANAISARAVVKMIFIKSRIALLADGDSAVVFGSFFYGHGSYANIASEGCFFL